MSEPFSVGDRVVVLPAGRGTVDEILPPRPDATARFYIRCDYDSERAPTLRRLFSADVLRRLDPVEALADLARDP